MVIGGIDTAKLPDKARIYFRRSVGRTLTEADKAMGYFYREKPYDLPHYHEEALFACLCMACSWKEDERGSVLTLPQCLQCLSQENSTSKSSIDNKVLAIISQDWAPEQGNLLGVQLARLVKRFQTQGKYSPDFAQLYEDLKQWNNPNSWVRKKWARDYFVGQPAQKNQEEEHHAI